MNLNLIKPTKCRERTHKDEVWVIENKEEVFNNFAGIQTFITVYQVGLWNSKIGKKKNDEKLNLPC